ncbi:MAG: hypothetical protein ACR2NN_01470 [Bryobacteraceae bacterium]
MQTHTTKLSTAGQVLDCARTALPFASILGQAFVSIPLGPEVQQVVPVRSSRFQAWLADNYYRQFATPPLDSALRGAVRQLEAAAWFNDGARPVVARRIAARGASVVLDLYNESGQVVEITAAGWRTTSSLGFCFANARNARPIPNPAESARHPSAAIQQFRALLNLGQADHWAAVLAWILAALRPFGPYPILILQGPASSGKSTLARLLRGLLDPNIVPFQPMPRSERELLHLAHSHWVLAFDHVRRLPLTLSDALVRLSSGAVLAMRETSGDLDPMHVFLQRPVILTTPADEHAVAWTSRSAVAARSIRIELPPIPAALLRPQQELLAEFESAHPFILAALCDAIGAALARPATEPFPAARRFAEQTSWIESAASVLGASSRQILQAIGMQDPLLDAIQNLLADSGHWTGTPTALLAALPGIANSASTLTRRLHALDPVGFTIEYGRAGRKGERKITLAKTDGSVHTMPSASYPQSIQPVEYKTARI